MEPLLVILDLDETLIHVPERPLGRAPDFLALGYSVYKRPHVDAFLAGVLARYRTAIWTASGQLYAEAVVAGLGIDPARLEFFWCAERCTERFDDETLRRSTVKVLRKVRRRGYDLERVLFVDDSPEKHVLNYGNLIHVPPFEGDLRDDELRPLLGYIDSLAAVPNLRKVEKRYWRDVMAAASLPEAPSTLAARR